MSNRILILKRVIVCLRNCSESEYFLNENDGGRGADCTRKPNTSDLHEDPATDGEDRAGNVIRSNFIPERGVLCVSVISFTSNVAIFTTPAFNYVLCTSASVQLHNWIRVRRKTEIETSVSSQNRRNHSIGVT